MGRAKITVVGAGNVGATAAYIAAQKQLGDITLIDIVEGLAQGKALDIAEASPIGLYDSKIAGGTDWKLSSNSDIVIITSGLPRKPGMSRDDLLAKNTQIVRDVTQKAVQYSPDCIIIVVCNPLDAMVYVASEVSGFTGHRVMGMAGALDAARFKYFLSCELGVSVRNINCVLMGGHGDDMVPLPRFTTVNGIPLTDLLEKEKIDTIIERTRKGGIEIVNLLGYSAYYAPAAGAVEMAEAILKDKKSVLSCCAYCQDQYNVGGYFIGVPVILGRGGVEKIVELNLDQQEKACFEKSLGHVKELISRVKTLI